MRHLLARTGLALTLLLSSTVATADDAKTEADARFKEGLALAKQGKYVEARTKYLQAYALDERPSLLLSLAIVEHGAARYVDAIEHLRRYFDSPKSAKEKQQEGELRDTLWKQLWAQTGHLKVSAPKGSALKVDGKPAGYAPLADVIDVTPGSHAVAADEETRSVVAVGGETNDVVFGGAVVSAPPPPPGGGDVTPPPRGEHHDSVAKWVVPGVIGAAGLVGVGVGVGFGLSSRSAQTDAKNIASSSPSVCSTSSALCDEYRGHRSDATSASTVSWIGYVGGGALVATAIVVFLVWPKDGKEASSDGARVAPMVGRGVLGATMGTTF